MCGVQPAFQRELNYSGQRSRAPPTTLFGAIAGLLSKDYHTWTRPWLYLVG